MSRKKENRRGSGKKSSHVIARARRKNPAHALGDRRIRHRSNATPKTTAQNVADIYREDIAGRDARAMPVRGYARSW